MIIKVMAARIWIAMVICHLGANLNAKGRKMNAVRGNDVLTNSLSQMKRKRIQISLIFKEMAV